jgi:hypothetical protein
MISLTTIYCILFIYVRIKAKTHREFTTANASGSYEMSPRWKHDAENDRHSSLQSTSTSPTKTNTKVTVEDRSSRPFADGERIYGRMNRASIILISYPMVYICLTMPMCIARVCQFTGYDWSLPAVYAGTVIYVCSGAVNVIVYTTTRQGIIGWSRLFRKAKPAKTNEASTKPGEYVPGWHDSGSDTERLTPPKSFVSSVPTLGQPSIVSERFSGDSTKGGTDI